MRLFLVFLLPSFYCTAIPPPANKTEAPISRSLLKILESPVLFQKSELAPLIAPTTGTRMAHAPN